MFGKRKYPKVNTDDGELVLRCSICNGEEVLCVKSKETGELHEVMLVESEEDLAGFCKANGLLPSGIRKVY